MDNDRSHSEPPLVAHVIYSLDIGGLENGLVNIINHMPVDRYRHAIICLTYYSDFHKRIRRDDLGLFALDKQPGHDLKTYFRLWRLLRRLRPAIVHTRNWGAIDCVIPAVFAGVRARVHGEHGRHIDDVDGENKKYVWLRRCVQPFVHRYIPMSKDLGQWLTDRIGVRDTKISQIYSGVDRTLFTPPDGARDTLPLDGFAPPGAFVIGSVGRMDPVKDQLTLVRGFLELLELAPQASGRLRLVHIGDGPLREPAIKMLQEAGAAELAWLPGARDDVREILRGCDVFVLPSLGEGISNTILEAMASRLPVVATRVGGNPELVSDGETGTLVPPTDPKAMASALHAYVRDPDLARRHGQAGWERVKKDFSIERMVQDYMDVYDSLLGDSAAVRR